MPRKRRNASLNAEALWNIQMEDDVMKKTRYPNMGSKKIRLSDSAKAAGDSDPVRKQREVQHQLSSQKNMAATKMNKKSLMSFYNQKKMKCAFPFDDKCGSSCVHQSESGKNYNNPSKVYRAGGKLTASVAPLVKSGVSVSDSKLAKEHAEENPIGRNSQVLLLPISLDPSVGGIEGSSVPLLTLHASRVNVDLMKCSIFNPIVAVSPLIGDSSRRTSEDNLHTRRSSGDQVHPLNIRYKTARLLDHFQSNNKASTSDQTEPLNLKLGESKIPHSSMVHSGKSKKIDFRASNRNQAPSTSMGQRSGHSMFTSKYRSNETFKNFRAIAPSYAEANKYKKLGTGTATRLEIGYNVSSPSSESSCSTDLEETAGESKKTCGRPHKNHINLRCKAAPPPSMGGSSSKYRREPSRKVTTSESSESNNNGWEWRGKPYNAYVYSVETAKPVLRRCYPAMKRIDDDDDDDVIMVRDCVMMRADGDEQAYVAKIAALWEHPQSKRMMISLLWFYRPEHTADARVLDQLEGYNDKELFASRHLDEISVACVEDKCYVLSYYQYCRFLASERKDNQLCLCDNRDLLPQPSVSRTKPHAKVPRDIDQSLVFFCRKLYDIKLHRLLKSFSPPTPLYSTSPKSSNPMTV